MKGSDCAMEKEGGSRRRALSRSRARPPSSATCRGWTACRDWRLTCEEVSWPPKTTEGFSHLLVTRWHSGDLPFNPLAWWMSSVTASVTCLRETSGLVLKPHGWDKDQATAWTSAHRPPNLERDVQVTKQKFPCEGGSVLNSLIYTHSQSHRF